VTSIFPSPSGMSISRLEITFRSVFRLKWGFFFKERHPATTLQQSLFPEPPLINLPTRSLFATPLLALSLITQPNCDRITNVFTSSRLACFFLLNTAKTSCSSMLNAPPSAKQWQNHQSVYYFTSYPPSPYTKSAESLAI
jgi:hypothetical protein